MNACTEAEQFEKIKTQVYDSADDACNYLAEKIAHLIKDRNAADKPCVLGLATGSTPVRLYRKLIQMHKEDGLSFQNVITFNLDEYYGLERSHKESYWRFMQDQLFAHIDIPEQNIHLPDGTIDRKKVFAHCSEYEQAITDVGGIDLQILGIGRTGHIGFNEPGSGPDSRTRLVTLDRLTRRDAARDFLGEANVPRHAITMGVGTILDAREVVLLAWGSGKADIIAESVEGEQSESIPASFLQRHKNVCFILDPSASASLTRFRHPWRVGSVDWNLERSRKAVMWLAQKVNKPVLKLVDEEYNAENLSELITEQGPAYNLNIRVFNEIQHTITGWPGGKPNVDDSNRPERASPSSKRVLVLSPEPQDAELSMAGTLHRLIDQKHDVQLVYMTSGALAVPDEDAKLAAKLIQEVSKEHFESESRQAQNIIKQLENKSLFDEDSKDIRTLKSFMRRGESRSACEICGLATERIHFMDLPFYEEGKYRQFKPSESDTEQIVERLNNYRPHQIFVTGTMMDPNSVSAICFSVFTQAFEQVKNESWVKNCRVWIYPEGHLSWPAHEIDMAVPLSPDELTMKKQAIYKHQTQRGQSPASGSSPNSPWEDAEIVNSATAKIYDELGLAEYEAIETFKRWHSPKTT